MALASGALAWKTAFQTSPVILQGGIAEFMPFGMLPIFAIPDLLSFPLGLLGGQDAANSLDSYFNFRPMPGSTMIEQDIGRYPFANSATAANAVINQPQHISLLMQAPAKGPMGYYAKLAIMVALREALLAHNERGGTYIVLTPSAIFRDCLMRSVRDVTGGETRQVQVTWQMDFERPLITLDQLEQVLNGAYKRFASGTAVVGQPSMSGVVSAGAQTVSPPFLPAQSNIPAFPPTPGGPLSGGGI